ncbi:alpha/beta-hydrolase [Mycena polygramma]|nr:alpha/beta-hydrolase [Mycena polygramma]
MSHVDTGYAPLRRQPFRAGYLLYQLLTAFVRVPCWALLALPRAWRPRKSWSWGRTMVVKYVRHTELIAEKVGIVFPSPNHLAIVPGKGFHGLWVEPIPQQYIVGKVKMWASIAEVSAARLPGYWIHRPGSTLPPEAPLMPGEKLVYFLHGGAYTRLSAHPKDIPSGIAHSLVKHIQVVHRTFAIEYRLSTTTPYLDTNPFPMALIDALTGYHYLVATLRVPPADIIIVGDSAGGNLALALVRYLVENPIAALPLPGSLLLLSPWADLGISHAGPTSSLTTCRASDFLSSPTAPPPHVISYSVRAFTGPFGVGAAEVNAYISPASRRIADKEVPFAGFPRTFISAGGAEVLRDCIRALYERMKRDMGEGEVRYLEAADSIHDFVLVPWVQEPQRGETLAAIAAWVAEG